MFFEILKYEKCSSEAFKNGATTRNAFYGEKNEIASRM